MDNYFLGPYHIAFRYFGFSIKKMKKPLITWFGNEYTKKHTHTAGMSYSTVAIMGAILHCL